MRLFCAFFQSKTLSLTTNVLENVGNFQKEMDIIQNLHIYLDFASSSLTNTLIMLSLFLCGRHMSFGKVFSNGLIGSFKNFFVL